MIFNAKIPGDISQLWPSHVLIVRLVVIVIQLHRVFQAAGVLGAIAIILVLGGIDGRASPSTRFLGRFSWLARLFLLEKLFSLFFVHFSGLAGFDFHSVLVSLPPAELTIVNSRVTSDSQPFAAPPAMLKVAVLLLEL